MIEFAVSKLWTRTENARVQKGSEGEDKDGEGKGLPVCSRPLAPLGPLSDPSESHHSPSVPELRDIYETLLGFVLFDSISIIAT